MLLAALVPAVPEIQTLLARLVFVLVLALLLSLLPLVLLLPLPSSGQHRSAEQRSQQQHAGHLERQDVGSHQRLADLRRTGSGRRPSGQRPRRFQNHHDQQREPGADAHDADADVAVEGSVLD